MSSRSGAAEPEAPGLAHSSIPQLQTSPLHIHAKSLARTSRNAPMSFPKHPNPSLLPHSPGQLLAAAMVSLCFVVAGCGGVRALLPTYTSIEATPPLPLDGEWRLEENGKRYRFEGGRMWLLEQLFVGPIRYDPGQVTCRDVFQISPTEYQGQDLASIGSVTFTAKEDRVELLVRSAIGPVHYTMFPIRLEDQAWYDAQLGSDVILPRSRPAPTALESLASPNSGGSTLLADVTDSSMLSAAQRASFGGYHALVIGNDRYRDLPALATAVNDAESISAILRDRYGFSVSVLANATRAQVLTSLRQLRETLTESDNLLIYYAGHGWLDTEADEGYWLPVDAEEDSDINWISNATITGYLRSIQAKHVMIVADSCYSGTLTRGIKLDVKPPDYLQRISRQRARIVLSSGGLEPVADGGGGGKHSAFARHFIDALNANQGVLDSTTLYSKIRRPVMLAADQAPELADIRKAGHEGGDFLFIRAARP